MTTENIHEIVELQHRIFTLGGTRSVENRIHQLKRLEEGILKYESAFYEVLSACRCTCSRLHSRSKAIALHSVSKCRL
ncbi:MAG: hypothetical protein MJ003_04305 [Paludibacteraceae bacterium]|nr:hypothetical protein [Paludibacteraceae bacterium]